jgi:hypothetical protein
MTNHSQCSRDLQPSTQTNSRYLPEVVAEAARQFNNWQPGQDCCWNCGTDRGAVDPLQACPHCGADTVPF